MSTTTTYPTWVRVDPKRYETEEQMDGTPDFVATREFDGWRVKWRSSTTATRGFERVEDFKDFVKGMFA